MTGKEDNNHRWVWIISTTVLAVVLVGAGVLAYRIGVLPRYDRAQAFYAPVFSHDKATVYYLHRESAGFSWGPGWEFLTPPAKIIVTKDVVHLERIALEDGRIDRLYTLHVPHIRKPQSRYRNRLFGIPFAELKWEGSNLLFSISLRADKEKMEAPSYRVATQGTWFEHSDKVVLHQQWKNDHRVFVPWNNYSLSDSWEVVSLQGKALVLADKDWQRKIVLRKSSSSKDITSEYIETIRKEQYSHREDIEKNALLKDTHARILHDYKTQGLSDNEARLRTNDEMERLGFYPRGPKIIAKEVGQLLSEDPVFNISEQEFLVGMFQDIDKAIQEPGKEIDFRGNYVRHRDFDTSEKINGYLKQGGTKFYVNSGDKLYLMEIERN